jgi:hypothetical protein
MGVKELEMECTERGKKKVRVPLNVRNNALIFHSRKGEGGEWLVVGSLTCIKINYLCRNIGSLFPFLWGLCFERFSYNWVWSYAKKGCGKGWLARLLRFASLMWRRFQPRLEPQDFWVTMCGCVEPAELIHGGSLALYGE